MMDMRDTKGRKIALAVSALVPLIGTWVVVVGLSLVIYASTVSAPVLKGTTWEDVVRVSSSLWIVTLGGTMSLGAVRLSLIPLSVTFFIAWWAYRSVKRVGITSWGDVGIVTASAAAVTTLIGLSSFEGTFFISAIVGASFIFFAVSLRVWTAWLQPNEKVRSYAIRTWGYVKSVSIASIGVACILFLIALVAGWQRVWAIYDGYVAGWSGTMMLTIIQLFYVPLILVWTLAFASGTPIHIGDGTSFSVFTTTPAPLPGIPVLGALPTTHPALFALPLIFVAIGAGSLVYVTRKRRDIFTHGRELLIELAFASLAIMLVVSIAGALSSGSLGPQRLHSVGVAAPLFALIAGVEIAVGMFSAAGIFWLQYRKVNPNVFDSDNSDNITPDNGVTGKNEIKTETVGDTSDDIPRMNSHPSEPTP